MHIYIYIYIYTCVCVFFAYDRSVAYIFGSKSGQPPLEKVQKDKILEHEIVPKNVLPPVRYRLETHWDCRKDFFVVLRTTLKIGASENPFPPPSWQIGPKANRRKTAFTKTKRSFCYFEFRVLSYENTSRLQNGFFGHKFYRFRHFVRSSSLGGALLPQRRHNFEHFSSFEHMFGKKARNCRHVKNVNSP